ncbi:DUF177 domain-containing protein [Geomicrobium sp. JCM 19055]|uniref:YceD family protein n=1 Tax=Geomicrobium sp. JCM 19055 TaxID=1460649 RepID=UPI00045ED67B|nr:YceD family protein [Geomicrobium sp. JCM 19055]GAJ99657.1 ribosomal protein L32p [Geomicrobium sp. JCM 19055]
MRWTIQQLLTSRKDTIPFEKDVNVSELVERDQELRDISPVHIKGFVQITSQYATFQFTATGTFVLPCARTLVDTTSPFEIDIIERFRIDGLPVTDDEDETLHEPENGYVDLLPYIKENILLVIPIRVINEDEDLKKDGLTSGNGWELSEKQSKENDDDQNAIDPRLKDLAKYFQNDQ